MKYLLNCCRTCIELNLQIHDEIARYEIEKIRETGCEMRETRPESRIPYHESILHHD